jgi:hypothetical protein
MIARHADEAKTLEAAVIERHCVREHTMNVQLIIRMSTPSRLTVSGAGGLHGNRRFVLAARPVKPQGRPLKGSGSRPMFCARSAHARVLPAPTSRVVSPLTEVGAEMLRHPGRHAG